MEIEMRKGMFWFEGEVYCAGMGRDKSDQFYSTGHIKF